MAYETRRRKVLIGMLAAMASVFTVAPADYTPGTLKAWWPMNDGAGTVVADQSGYGSNGAMTVVAGLPRFQDISGAFGGRALLFRRSTNDGAWFRSNLFNISERGTLSVRVRFSGISWLLRNQIMEGPGNDNFFFQYRYGFLARRWNARVAPVDIANGENPETSNGPATYGNTWYTIQYTWDRTAATSGVVRIYFNGTEYNYGSGTAGNSAITNWSATSNTPGGMMWLGRDPGTLANSFDGALDDFAIYNTVLTQTQRNVIRTSGVAALASPAPMVHYPFNDAAGSFIADDAGANGMDLNLRRPGVPMWDITTPPNAAVGESLAFMNDYAVVTANGGVGDGLNFPKDQGTVVFWVRRESWSATVDSNVARQAILNDSTGAFSIEFGPNGTQSNRLYFSPNTLNNQSNFFMINTPVNNRNWHHVAYTFDLDAASSANPAAPAKINAWLNGVAQGNFVGANDPDMQWTSEAVTGPTWRIGRRFDNTRPLDGYLADMAIFSEVLTEADIQFIRDNGVAAFIGQNEAPPVVDLNGALPGINTTTTFNFGSGPVIIAPAGVVADTDSVNLASMTITLTDLQDAGSEFLTVDTTGTAITADIEGNGLTLTGADTPANYQQVLRTITYEHTTLPPTGISRTVTFQANDGALNSQTATAIINFTGIPNVLPVVDLNGDGPGINTSVTYVIGGGPQEVANLGTVVDVDSEDIVSMTITLTNPQNVGNESIGFNLEGTEITSAGTATAVTLSGAASAADYETVLRTVTYNNNAAVPTIVPPRQMTFVANDGQDNSLTATATISLTIPGNPPPVVDLNGGDPGNNVSAIWIEGDGPVVFAPVSTVTDANDAVLASMTLTLVNGHDGGQESLAVDTTGTSISANYNLGVLTLTGPDTVARFQQVLRTAAYDNSSIAPTVADRSVTVVTTDGQSPSITRTATISIVPFDNPSVVDLNGDDAGFDHAVTYVEGDGAVAVATDTATITDEDSDVIDEMIVTLDGILDDGFESLAVNVRDTEIVAEFAPSTGSIELSLIGPDTVRSFENVLRSLTYEHSSANPTAGDRTVTVSAIANGEFSNSPVSTITVMPVNSAPEVSINKGLMVLRGGTGLINATRLEVTDADNTDDQIEFTIVTPPTVGSLTMSSFTMEDVRNGKLSYTHNGTMTIADSFVFEAADPSMDSSGPVTFNIAISTDAASTTNVWTTYD